MDLLYVERFKEAVIYFNTNFYVMREFWNFN